MMKENAGQGTLGDAVRTNIATIYDGLPDEPRFTLRYLLQRHLQALAVMVEIFLV